LVPTGTVVLFRALIAKQMFALTINPQDLEIAQADARRALLAIIGIFANEGQFSVLDFATASGQFAKTGLEDVSPSRTVKTIAFFLPQFHTIPENDLWWGKGFSEWHNVVRARPLFRGHYQPRIPADLGFYDLRSQTTQIAQARLASDHGVHGFCYYYYWFSGKKLLNEPIEQMLKSGKPDFPFCVCWANENWSRNWDGQHRHVLMEQDYSTESNRALIHEFIEMMKDERYIRHHGKPLLLVYRIKIIPNWLETAAMWRAECRKAGLGEIHLCSIRFGLEPLEGPPPLHGLDSYVLFPPQDMKFVDVRHSVHDLNGQFGGSIFSYDAVVDGDVERFRAGYPWPVHRGAMLGWDNTARRLTDARIFVGCTPMRYRAWLKNILEQESRYNKDDESLLFINAWNEWAEGTTLEPDQRYGTSYLEATQSALARYRVPSASAALEHSRKPALLPAPPPAAPVKHAAVLKDPKLTLWFAGRAQYKPGAPTILLCAHISGHQLFGGERSFLDVLGALSRMDVNVVVTVPSSNNKQYIGLLGDLSLGVYAFHYPQWVSDRDPDPSLTLLFSDIIAAHNVSLVYANTIVLIEPEIAAQRMGRLSAVHARELITVDDALRERIGLPVQTIIKTVFARTDFIVANSRATDRIFAREDRTYYVPNAVDANELNLENKIGEKVRIGIVSSNIPKKGVADFVAVAKACEDIAHLADFVVIGPDNAQIETWKKDVVEGRLPKNLKFLGYRETPRQAIAELNVLLNLSWFAESFGRTVAEAMAARRPVIAYEWGALPELVQHGKTGFMAPFGETEKIAGYVRQLCQDKALIQRMGEAGLAFIKDGFSHEALYQHLHRAMGKIRQSPQWQRLQAAEVKNSAQNPVTVVIPVYNAPAEVENCIQSVIKHTPLDQVEVLVINDGSSDKQIPGVLKKFEGVKGLRILHNETNIGYTKTVNKGIKEAGQCDVILLNSDAVVTPAWLAGMRASAYAEQNIGTVTAMSDNAGAFSFPVQGINNPKPDYLSHDEYAMRVVDATLHCRFVDVPTGSGFCMYIRRDMMNQIGLFDEEAFPRGYGEENDFCMRALAAGWRNIITPWAFIYHIRTASFKGEKEALVQAGVNVVTRKYPEYSKKVKEAWQGQAMAALRKASALPI
jgi:GT2 family glycosyltransferase/glycosyltransferase involved in cell wall biosynthesis